MPYDPALALLGAEKSAAAYLYPTYTPGNAKFILETVNGVQNFVPAGTCDPGDVCEDLEFYTVFREGLGNVVKGDVEYWETCRDCALPHLDKSLPIQFFSHSLGGSASAIGALDLKNKGFNILPVYTYGAKRSGTESFKAAWDSSGLQVFRFCNKRDPIPMLESWLPNVGTRIDVGMPGIPLIEFHAIDEYVSLLGDNI